jgi:SAM-dependent methyltransferase
MKTEQSLSINKDGWNKIAAKFYGKTALPQYGPLAQSETDLKLIGDVRGARVLEIGCGSGHSLLYLAQQGASEVWGLDLSHSQIEFASSLLEANGLMPRLFESPMEENPGIPLDYFDLVISIYALGWTVDLPKTLDHIRSYLKPGGCLVFSWEHPAYRCIRYEGGQFVISHSYHDEGAELQDSWLGAPIVQSTRKFSTYLNELIDAGLIIEKVVESAVDTARVKSHNLTPEYWYSVPKAKLIPTTMIIKARKLADRRGTD